MKNNKTLLHLFIIGAKLAYITPILPYIVSSFKNHPLIRVFSVVAGLSVFTVLLKKHLLLFLSLQYLILFLALLHIFYIFCNKYNRDNLRY